MKKRNIFLNNMNCKLLDGQVAIITGSTRGNGRAIADLFSEHGANVVLTGRDDDEVQAAVKEIAEKFRTDPLGFRIDVTSASDVARLVSGTVSKYGRINIL